MTVIRLSSLRLVCARASTLPALHGRRFLQQTRDEPDPWAHGGLDVAVTIFPCRSGRQHMEHVRPPLLCVR